MTLADQLRTGITNVARAWAVIRKDGMALGFTDHDMPLAFEGVTFAPDSGLTARAVEQSTGLSVDNSEAMGVLRADAITEDDIAAGRYDGATVRFWHVNWANADQHILRFAGTIGEIRRQGGAFHAELRSLAEALNQPMGRVYQRDCPWVLGDARCGFDTSAAGFSHEAAIAACERGTVLRFAALDAFEERWFENGLLTVLDGTAIGCKARIKRDYFRDGQRVIELWEPLGLIPATGDQVRIMAGCDKRMTTCRLKFGNNVNFGGFPDIPGEDWLMSTPLRASDNNGGSLR